MSRQHRSISQRLEKAKNPETRAEIISEYISDWQKITLQNLEEIKSSTNLHQARLAANVGQRQQEKRFAGLAAIVNALEASDNSHI